jgi:4'-phosphopantetheinyl transferase
MIPHLYWLIQNLKDVPEREDWLGECERSVLAGLRFEKRRKDWLLGRWTAKRAISACLNQKQSAMPSVEIRAAADGAPEAFWCGEPAGISLSISHSNSRSFCSVGPPNIRMGCDLEKLETRDDRLIADYFAPEEIAWVGIEPPEKTLRANLIWSAKESMLKALREGLRRDTRSVLVRPDLQDSESGWMKWSGHCIESSQLFHGWWCTQDGFVHTLVSDINLEPMSLGATIAL